MANVIDAVLRFKDEFTSKFDASVQHIASNSKKIQQFGKNISKVGDNIAKAGSTMTKAISLPIAGAGIACFKLASDASETANKIEVVFGKNAKAMNEWANTAIDKMGMASSTALEMASVYGDMANGMGLSDKQSKNMAQSLTQLAADLSSFKNVSTDISNTALKGIFTGEGESLKQLGIIMTDTTLSQYALDKGYKTAWKDMTQAEKVQLRYNYVMEKTKTAQGDFERTSSGAANQSRMLKERVKELGTQIGTNLLPIGTKLLQNVNNLIKRFSGLSASQKETIVKVAGLVAAVGPCVLIFGKITSTVGKTITTGAKLVKGIKKGVGLFSMLGPSGVAGLVVVGLLAIVAAGVAIYKNWDKIVAFANKLKQKLSAVFKKIGIDTKGLGKGFSKLKNTVKTSVSHIATTVKKITKALKPVLQFVSKVFVKGFKVAFAGIKSYVSQGIKGITEVIKGLIKIFDGIITFIDGVFTGNWKKAWTGVKNIFGGIFSSLTAFVKTPFNAIIGLVNGVIGAINKISVDIPKWVPGVGGKKIGFDFAKIPYLAKGTKNWKGGPAVTQDKGGELMDLPRGTRVYPHDESIRQAYKDGANSQSKGSIIIKKLADQIIVRNDSDIDKIVDRVATRLLEVIDNGGGEVIA